MVYGLYGLMDNVLDDIFAEAVETAPATTTGNEAATASDAALLVGAARRRPEEPTKCERGLAWPENIWR